MSKNKHLILGIATTLFALLLLALFWHRFSEFNHAYKDELLSIATIVIAIFTSTLWFATTGLYKMALKQSKDMKASLNISQQAVAAAIQANKLNREIFIASERPWIPINVNIAGPLSYDTNGLTIHLRFHFKNIGKSPAKNVWANFRFVIPELGTNFNPVSIQNELIQDAKRHPSTLGHTVFPGEEIMLTISTAANNDDLKKATEKFAAIFPYLIGTISYNFVFEEEQHQTAFIYEVRREGLFPERSKQKNRSVFAIFPDEGDIPAVDIRLFHHILGGFSAD
jgi:hypothetical protein